jgi:hypothetical protein
MASDSLPPSKAAPTDLRVALEALVREYRVNDTDFQSRLAGLADAGTPDALVMAVEPYRDMPDVVAPVYERIVAAQPKNARALVILANAYWLSGRGPDVVGELAERARSADPRNRAAWHLWALAESSPRDRVERWRHVCVAFPEDDLARANLADNAASLAGAEHDPAALQLALETYADLRARAIEPAQVAALDQALKTLKDWRV